MLSNKNPVELDQVQSMLRFIPAHDRPQWIRVGMALKSEFGDNGFSTFDDWSQGAENYNPKSANSAWKSFNDGAIGIGSLIHLAKENGWTRDAPAALAPPPRRASKPQRSNTASYAAELWLAANKWMQADDWLSQPSPDKSVATHPYAIAKGLTHAGGAGRGIASGSIIGKNSDCIIVPIRTIETDKVQGVQCINPEGRKQTFGSVSGGGLILGNTLDKSLTWYVCEGWASAVSMVFHHQKGNGVCAASFGKGRQKEVAELIEQAYQPDEIVILLEDDS
jgi:hypothetical protein